MIQHKIPSPLFSNIFWVKFRDSIWPRNDNHCLFPQNENLVPRIFICCFWHMLKENIINVANSVTIWLPNTWLPNSSEYLIHQNTGVRFFSLVFRPPFEYRTIWQLDTNLPFEYHISPVFRWLLYLLFWIWGPNP